MPTGSSAQNPPGGRDDAIAVISAYGAFRLLLVLLVIWTFFAGFALLTQGIGAISFGGEDDATERILGAYLLMLAPIYGLIAWRREQYRLLTWLPYAAQLAIIAPTAFDIATGDRDLEDGSLMLVVSIIFLALLVYFWRSSHPLDFFRPAEHEELERELEDGALDRDDDEAWDEEEDEQAPPSGRSGGRH